MNKFEKMGQSYAQMEQIRESVKGLVREAKQGFEKRETEILQDVTLTHVGQKQQLDKVRGQYLNQLLGQLQSAKKEFDKTSDNAVAFADEILLAELEKPSAAAEAEFERRLTALKTDTVLAANTKSGLSKLETFVNTIDNPYFARKMMAEFPALAASFVNKDVSSQLKLGHINTKLTNVASTEEQKQAQQIKESTLSKKDQPLNMISIIMLRLKRSAIRWLTISVIQNRIPAKSNLIEHESSKGVRNGRPFYFT